jgi:hypothetical protein
LDRGNIRVWIADGAQHGDHYVAAFNIGESAEKVDLLWNDIGLGMQGSDVRDLWRHQELGKTDGLHIQLRPHASVLYRVRGGAQNYLSPSTR